MAGESHPIRLQRGPSRKSMPKTVEDRRWSGMEGGRKMEDAWIVAELVRELRNTPAPMATTWTPRRDKIPTQKTRDSERFPSPHSYG